MEEGHGQINYKDTKTKCRLCLCLIELIDWRYIQLCWYFRPSFVNYCPCNLLSGSPPQPLPRFPKSKYIICRQCVAGRGWGEVLSCAGDHILQEFNTLFLTRFRNYKTALPPKTENLGGERGFRQINTCRKVPLKVDLALLSISLIFLQGRKTREVALLLRKMVKSNLFDKYWHTIKIFAFVGK